MAKSKNIVVVYHGDCPDGFSGAWAVWKKFGSRARYVGASDRVNPPTGLDKKEVYFIDWVYPLSTTLRLKRRVKKLVAIDHHITVEAATKTADVWRYDINHSAAVLAWKYFHPKKPLPKLFRYIEDYDLWRFRLPNTKEVGAFLDLVPFGFRDWSRVVTKVEQEASRRKVIEFGRSIRKYQEKMVVEVADNAHQVLFEGHKVFAVNAPVLHSDLGHYIATKHPPFAIVWWEKKDRSIRVSLRSIGFDVERIARKYGGGGHKTAAGFSLPAGRPLPWKPVKK